MIWTPERIEAARRACLMWYGTPHRDRMAIVTVGVDCINFVHEVLIEAGILDRRKFGTYTTHDGTHSEDQKMRMAVEASLHVRAVSPDEPEFGDIAIFKTHKASAHCGFVDPPHLWHALARRTVSRSEYSQWKPRVAVLLRLERDGWRECPAAVLKRIS